MVRAESSIILAIASYMKKIIFIVVLVAVNMACMAQGVEIYRAPQCSAC